jgi:hypothetical protein
MFDGLSMKVDGIADLSVVGEVFDLLPKVRVRVDTRKLGTSFCAPKHVL